MSNLYFSHTHCQVLRSMQNADNPVAVIPSEGAYRQGVRSPIQKVFLCRGERVMLRHNLSVRHGLVNGRIGTIEHIVYQGTEPPQIPMCVLVRFPGYAGPNVRGLVPIVKANFSVDGETVQNMINIPLLPAYAMTVHKSQGCTFDSVHLNLGQSDLSLGSTYVSLSRVRALTDLTLSPVTFDRMKSQNETQQKLFISRQKFLDKLVRLNVL